MDKIKFKDSINKRESKAYKERFKPSKEKTEVRRRIEEINERQFMRELLGDKL